MNIRNAFLCASIGIKKWAINARIYALLALLLVFSVWNLSGIYSYALNVGYGVSPWVFPHIMIHSTAMPVYACFAILLFCDAPFIDRHMPFLMMRTGRNSWLLGQLLYIVMASLLYTFVNYLITVVTFLPIMDFTGDWGKVLRTLAANPSAAYEKGIHSTTVISGSIVSSFSAIDATLISLGMFFLVTLFTGILIFCLNLAAGKFTGVITAGILAFISYFCIFIGMMTIGLKIYYFSPFSWASMQFIDWTGSGDAPSFAYAAIFLLAASLLLSIISVVSFSKKDIDFAEGME